MALVALTACDVEGELEICPYNARLDYHYSPHGMERNELLGYVGKHCQYLFDEGGVLLDTIPLRGTYRSNIRKSPPEAGARSFQRTFTVRRQWALTNSICFRVTLPASTRKRA